MHTLIGSCRKWPVFSSLLAIAAVVISSGCESRTLFAQQQRRVELSPAMLTHEGKAGDASGLIDEQREIIGPPVGTPETGWSIPADGWKDFPQSIVFDLGEPRPLAALWLFDVHGQGEVVISGGEPESWVEIARYQTTAYMKWVEVPLNVETRSLRLTRMSPGAAFNEIALYEHTPKSWAAYQEQQAESARQQAAKAEALANAKAEALRRPQFDLPPYGRLSLVDEIDCAAAIRDAAASSAGQHLFRQSPVGATRGETILGQPACVIVPQDNEAALLTWRIGRNKLLRPGAAYVLAIEYPEDRSRSMVVINTGNESVRGFHTGQAVGDALQTKYVDSLPESLDIPLSGRWETWSQLFYLHDRFAELGPVRGPVPRTLGPEDGFDVTLAHFSAVNDPLSAGAAVGRIRLFEVIDEAALAQPLSFPPAGLPHRHLFWREEMSDGVIERKNPQPGIADPIEWYRHKAQLMQFLGMNTFSKDLLEFGACQHWDPSPYGGHDWVFYDEATKGLWEQIVTLIGERGFDVLPYYEYSGSKGYKGLGHERRAKPLTRDDAYTHITWIESANADLTDPDAIADFRKMLELTVGRLTQRANFCGIWLRPRNQLPISFAPQTLARFAHDRPGMGPVTREQLRQRPELYASYIEWWQAKRRQFLIQVHEELQTEGLKSPVVLWTGCSAEPGVNFPGWERYLVTDRPEAWSSILRRPEQLEAGRRHVTPILERVVYEQELYRKGLQLEGRNWGDWEIQHAQPADDPKNYADVPGVLFSHAINRRYTVNDPRTFADYRGPSGLAVVRHYSLNEHMLVDSADQQKTNYFVCDFERTGPYCMLAEALAVANGDPTLLGYLVGTNYARGFPGPVREFNAHFLALPALPSQRLEAASNDPEIVVRRIQTREHGDWLAIVNTGLTRKATAISVPLGALRDAVSGEELRTVGGQLRLTMSPCQLRTLRLDPTADR